MFKRHMTAVATAFSLLATPLWAGDITIEDAYLRSTTPSSKTGAAFFIIQNAGDTGDRLIAAEADVAARVELHTHEEDANGVMRMREIEGGIAVPAAGGHMLRRGGDHVMFMGLTRPLEQGETIPVTLIFERAGPVEVAIVVDRERRADHAGHGHGHGD